jgi:hypothetical protein
MIAYLLSNVCVRPIVDRAASVKDAQADSDRAALQVEHIAPEEITGVDLVQCQLMVGASLALQCVVCDAGRCAATCWVRCAAPRHARDPTENFKGQRPHRGSQVRAVW